MTREEAIQILRTQYPHDAVIKEALGLLIPELRESEDEMIRKEIINYLNFAESHNLLRSADYEKKKGWLSYLEKQKDAFENGRQLGIMQEQARRELECDEQKEPKPAEWSEEEIGHLYTLASYIKSKGYEDDGEFLEGVANKLKSLRPSWKPSEEQMEALNAMNCCGELSYQGQQQLLIDLYQQLKKLI